MGRSLMKRVTSRMSRRLTRKTKHATRVKTRGSAANSRRPKRWGITAKAQRGRF